MKQTWRRYGTTNSECKAAAVILDGKVAEKNSSKEDELGVWNTRRNEMLSAEKRSVHRKKRCRSRRVVVSVLGSSNVTGADHAVTSTSTAVDWCGDKQPIDNIPETIAAAMVILVLTLRFAIRILSLSRHCCCAGGVNDDGCDCCGDFG